MRVGLTTLGLAAALGCASAVKVLVINSCATEFELSHLGKGTIISVNTLVPGGGLTVELPAVAESHLFKAGRGPQATLAEITYKDGKTWYDISIIPTGLGPNSGPGNCANFEECKRRTGGTGFNLPMQMSPQWGGCPTITCMADGCPEAYLFPDDVKTNVCPTLVDLTVTFCPGGPGKPTTPPPPPTPAPSVNETSLNMLTGGGGLSEFDDGSGLAADEAAEERDLDLDDESSSSGFSEPPTITIPAPTAVAAPQQEVQEVTTKSSQESSTGPEVYVLLSIGGAAMVAGAAIFVSRKKRRDVEALEDKTPRPTTTIAHPSFILATPGDATVL